MNVILRNSFFMGLFNVFGRGSGFIRYLLLVGFLNKLDFGLVTFAFSLGEVGRNFMDWGLDNLVSRDGARDYGKLPNYFLHGLIIKIGLGVLLFFLLFLYLIYYRDLTWYELMVVYAALAGSAMLSLTGVLRSCFTAYERMEFVFYTNLPCRLTALLALFLVLYFGLPVICAAGAVSLENFLWFMLLGGIALRFFSLNQTAFSPRFIGYMLLESLPLGLYQFFNNMYINLDVIMIESIMGGREFVAPYTYASLFIKGVLMLLSGYMIAIYPALSRYYQADEGAYNRLFRQSANVLLTMTIPGSIIMALWAEGWMNLIRDTDPIAVTVFQILSVTLNFSVLNTLMIIVFTSRNKQWWLVAFCGVGVGISFALNWYMIPIYDQMGGALASLISQVLLFIIMGISISRLFDLHFPFAKPFGILLVSLAVGGVTYSIPALPLLVAPVVFGLLFILAVWLFGVLSPEEWERLLKIIKTKNK